MTDKSPQIKSNAKIAFEKGDHGSAFETLFELENIDEVVAYIEKNDKRTKKENWFAESDFFWSDFVMQQKYFSALLSSESAEQLLHNYFESYKSAVPEFEQKVATEFPELFVKAIRVNQVFFKSDRIDLLKSLSIGSDFKIHMKIWQKIFEIEGEQWAEIQKELQNIFSLSFEEILSYCIIWLETNRFRNSDKDQMNHLANVYNFFIELVLRNKSCKQIHIEKSEDFHIPFFKVFTENCQNKKITKENPVSLLLLKISDWIHFQDSIVSPYSFDLNIEPTQENELVYFNSTPQTFYKWLLGGVRYDVNELNYLIKGSEIVEYLEKTKQLHIPGETESDIQLNRNSAEKKYATLRMLSDLSCKQLKLKNRTKISVQKVLEPLMAYSFNRLDRYENRLQKLFRDSENWNEAFTKLTIEAGRTDIDIKPYFLMSESEYEELNKEGLAGLTEDSTKEVLQLFSWSPNTKYDFDRFKYKYQVWQSPFVKTGTFFFCPMLFFANNNWFYAFAQKALFQPTDSEDTESMETYLAGCFEKKGWKVKTISKNESNEIHGDIDIFVEDKNYLLFIQLKRTYFRLTLKESYYEVITRDSKAVSQLNNAEKFLEKPNDIYQMKHKPHKWIVSNSFENIGNKIDGCNKINYFELLNTLESTEIKTLNELIQELENDKRLKKIATILFQKRILLQEYELFEEMRKPLTIFESKKYKQVIFSEDENQTKEYNSLFNRAMELDRKKYKYEALRLLKKCADMNPNDADVYGFIANILADMRVYDKSFIIYRQALKILPNDPYITRNYSVALMEAGYLYDGLLMMLELFEIFPMLGDIGILFEANFEHALKNGFLREIQIIKLKSKWDSLN